MPFIPAAILIYLYFFLCYLHIFSLFVIHIFFTFHLYFKVVVNRSAWMAFQFRTTCNDYREILIQILKIKIGKMKTRMSETSR